LKLLLQTVHIRVWEVVWEMKRG